MKYIRVAAGVAALIFPMSAVSSPALAVAPQKAVSPVYEGGYVTEGQEPYEYKYTYSIVPTYADVLSGNEIWERLADQFSEVFPISGMVDNPEPGQEVTLFGDNPVRILEVGERHIKILSLEGHVLGSDNTVVLGITADGRELHAEAYGPKHPGLLEGLIARPTWNSMANRIVHAIYDSEPVGVIPSAEEPY